jgi:hypothetical protein
MFTSPLKRTFSMSQNRPNELQRVEPSNRELIPRQHPQTWTKGTIKPQNPKCRLYWFDSVYRLEIQSVMLVFSTPLVNYCPFTFSLTSPTPPLLYKINVQYMPTVCGWGGGGGVELCCKPYSAGVTNLFLTK